MRFNSQKLQETIKPSTRFSQFIWDIALQRNASGVVHQCRGDTLEDTGDRMGRYLADV